jgi:MtN3 and saliva related transmembrane protein
LEQVTLIVGLVAGLCSTAAFVPQVVKIWREGDTEAISLRMYVWRSVGFVLWLAYGIALGSLPLVLVNIVCILLGGAVLVLKLKALGRLPGVGGGTPREA